MSTAFPRRQAQRDFLAYYATLKDDDEENGEELIAEREEPSDDDESEEVLGLIDHSHVRDDEARHKQLDAARRADEEKALQALAQRFEARASDYDYDAGREDHAAPWRAAQQLRFAARRHAEAEQAEMERAWRTKDEEEKKRAEALKKRKHDELGALYAAYGAIDAGNEASGGVVGPVSPLECKGGVRASHVKQGKKRFRISKKSE